MNDTPNVPHDLESPSPQAVSVIVPTFREAANTPPWLSAFTPPSPIAESPGSCC